MPCRKTYKPQHTSKTSPNTASISIKTGREYTAAGWFQNVSLQRIRGHISFKAVSYFIIWFPIERNKHDLVCTVLLVFFFSSITLIEPGPVMTEFEHKVYEEGLKTDLSKADKDTADMFTNIYLKNYKQIFESVGQTAEDIAEVQ